MATATKRGRTKQELEAEVRKLAETLEFCEDVMRSQLGAIRSMFYEVRRVQCVAVPLPDVLADNAVLLEQLRDRVSDLHGDGRQLSTRTLMYGDREIESSTWELVIDGLSRYGDTPITPPYEAFLVRYTYNDVEGTNLECFWGLMPVRKR